MSAAALILQVQESGVALRLEGGLVKARGPREAVARWLVLLRENRAALADVLQAKVVETLPDAPTDWHTLDAAYLAHHFNCVTCIAAGGGSRYGLRCGTGEAAWQAYATAS